MKGVRTTPKMNIKSRLCDDNGVGVARWSDEQKIVFKHHHQRECSNAASSSSMRSLSLFGIAISTGKIATQNKLWTNKHTKRTTTTCTHNEFNIVFKSPSSPYPLSFYATRSGCFGYIVALLHGVVKLNSVARGTQCMLIFWIYVFTSDAWMLLCWQQFCLILHAQHSLELCGWKSRRRIYFAMCAMKYTFCWMKKWRKKFPNDLN